jgi:glycosyltransferase involved in cell wall biosynthesis
MTKIALLTSATGGGGGIAAKRVYNALMQVKDNGDQIDLLDMKSLGGPIPTDVAPHSGGSNKIFSDTHYTVEFPGYVRSEVVDRLCRYDALNIHWCSYLLTLSEIHAIACAGKKIVFTCHDFYYFLGGCHYPHACNSWQSGCTSCPQVDTNRFPDYSPRDNLEFKKNIFSMPNVVLTVPSNYLAYMASSIMPYAFNHPKVIRNPLDGKLFYRSKETSVKKKPKAIQILLIADSAKERRKALPHGLKAVDIATKELNPKGIKIELMIVGGDFKYLEEPASSLQCSVKMLGKLQQEELAQTYRNVDIIFSPSLEDNWPNILVEAYACGALAVVGPGHGCEEFVNTYECGLVSETYRLKDFAEAICKLIELINHDEMFGHNGTAYNNFAEDHDPQLIGMKYLRALSS